MKRVIISASYEYRGYSIEDSESGYRIPKSGAHLNNIEYATSDEAEDAVDSIIDTAIDSRGQGQSHPDYLRLFFNYSKYMEGRIILPDDPKHVWCDSAHKHVLCSFLTSFIKIYPDCNLVVSAKPYSILQKDNSFLYLYRAEYAKT